jgi:hypothetical protein
MHKFRFIQAAGFFDSCNLADLSGRIKRKGLPLSSAFEKSDISKVLDEADILRV